MQRFPEQDNTPVWFITGCSTGLGRALAELIVQRGWRVVVTARDKHAIADIERSAPELVLALSLDVTRPADIDAAVAATRDQFGRIDVLVNNAGMLAPQSRLEELGFERMQRIFAVNAIGPILCAQQAVKRMAYRHNGPGGVVINVSSASARLGSPNEYVDYAASKGALETFTIGFAKEVAREGIRVNCIRPGHIYTDMHASGGEPGRVDRVKDSIPMGRGGQPEEVARAILWLASAEASFVTGTFLDVTGGK